METPISTSVLMELARLNRKGFVTLQRPTGEGKSKDARLVCSVSEVSLLPWSRLGVEGRAWMCGVLAVWEYEEGGRLGLGMVLLRPISALFPFPWLLLRCDEVWWCLPVFAGRVLALLLRTGLSLVLCGLSLLLCGLSSVPCVTSPSLGFTL